ncbi:aliphatic sulfonate ABC transporter [Marinifilum sp. JC120]|nr:aliphatic sulfonate ABC transporter [Marinifilum sp. JC120]
MAIPAQAEELKEINISYVKSPFNLQIMVIKEKMLLEKEFTKDGIKVNWHTITSGAKQAQAMAAGSLDLASVINSTSVLLANAAGNKVRIVGGVSRPAKTFAIVAGKNGPRTIEELKGKTIAGPKGTVLHQMLVAALESKGLKESDVKMLSMGLPKARTAMLGGQVDAALLAASLVIKSEEAGAHVVATADGLVSPKLVVGARDEFAQQHPDMIARYLKVQREAMDFIVNNQKEAITIGAKEQGISIKDATILFSQSGYTNAITIGDVESMREDLAFLHKNNMVKKTINPAEACLPVAFME